MADRFDVFTTKKWNMDARGRLIVNSTPTRAGVFKYITPEGKTVRELRHEDDVFSQETMDSLNGIPYTTQSNHISLMNSKNVRSKTYGFTLQNAVRVDDHSQIDIKITDEDEIEAVTRGDSLELSNGYTCDVLKESGEYKGEKYDARQTNIIYDHVARVNKARGGESCRIRLDSESAICGIEAERLDSSGETQNHSTGDNMSEKTKVIQRELPLRESGKFRLDAQDIEIDEAQEGNLKTFLGREKQIFAALKESETEKTKQSVKMDSLQKENEALTKKIENSVPADRMDQEIEKRTNLYKMAEESKIKDFKSMSIKDLGKKLVEKSGLFNSEKLDNEEYVDFAIEHMQEDHTKKVLKSKQNLDFHQQGNFDSSEDEDSSLEEA